MPNYLKEISKIQGLNKGINGKQMRLLVLFLYVKASKWGKAQRKDIRPREFVSLVLSSFSDEESTSDACWRNGEKADISVLLLEMLVMLLS